MLPLSPVILGFGREGAMLLPEGWTGLDSRPHSPTEQASTGDGQTLAWVHLWRWGENWLDQIEALQRAVTLLKTQSRVFHTKREDAVYFQMKSTTMPATSAPSPRPWRLVLA